MRGVWFTACIALSAPAAFAQGKASDTPPSGAAAPAANAPAPAPAAAPAGPTTVTLRAPSGGSYTAYFQEATGAALKEFTDKVDLEIPRDAKQLTLIVLDRKSGYAARRSLQVAGSIAEQGLTAKDFTLVQKVRVSVTGKGDKPIAQGSVALTDSAKTTQRKLIESASNGTAEFEFVASGSGSLAVTPQGGSATTKDVSIDVPKGEASQTIPVALPEVTAVVEAASAPPAATASGAGAPAAAPAPSQPAPQAAPAPQPAQPPPSPYNGYPGYPPPPRGSDFGSTVVGFLFLAAVIGGAYLYMRNKGITLDMVLKKLGVQPETVVQGGGSAAGASFSPAGPGPAPAPPPVVADPNACQFCGQPKDAAGGCACTVAPGGAATRVAPRSDGPRLVGMSGVYFGQVFPIRGEAVIGREPTNPIPLDRDNTTSRQHARITVQAGGYALQDLGSANGTTVNGMRVTGEVHLNSGDEVVVGGTRFRFEV
jgi:hypothetical protein